MPYSSPPCSLHEVDSYFSLITLRDLRIKRIYDPASRSDGFRVLVDRLWPRGISKRRAALNDWQPELARKPLLIDSIHERALDQPVTLLYAAKDPAHNHALVLKQFIEAA